MRSLRVNFFIPGPILMTRMLPGSPFPWRDVDEAKNSGIALGSNSSACLHASHIASAEASKNLSVRQSLPGQLVGFQSFERENDYLLDVLRGAHVSDRLVRCGPDCLTAGLTHRDEFHLGAEGAIVGIALQHGVAQGLCRIVKLVHPLLHFSSMSNGCSYPSQPIPSPTNLTNPHSI